MLQFAMSSKYIVTELSKIICDLKSVEQSDLVLKLRNLDIENLNQLALQAQKGECKEVEQLKMSDEEFINFVGLLILF